MTERVYDAADLRVIELDEHVRRRPAMYFGVGQGSPELATRVLCAVLGHSLHPATRVGASHTLQVEAEISDDRAFSVEDDQADALDEAGQPKVGYYGSLLGPNRWLSAAAAALSTRTVVEVWREGHGFRQEHAGIRPLEAPQEFAVPVGTGTRVTVELDAGYVGRHVRIATDLNSLDLHGPSCREQPGPGCVVLRDRRDPARPVDIRYR